MVYVFTSCTGSYITNARILAHSVKKHHPNWHFVLLFNDLTPENINWDKEPFDEVFFSHWLTVNNFRQWVFGYSVIEFCTATKGIMSQVLLKRQDASHVVYLDPDTAVFSPLVELEEVLTNHDVILTPHLTDREYNDEAIWSHEMAALKHGTFNLGFFVIKNSKNGWEYLDWWADRLRDYSYIDHQSGLFTDQKWCNLAPYLFEGIHVLIDRSYNVATWNMTNRHVARSSANEWLVNRRPLRFYHFSGFGHDFAWADRELALFTKENDDLRDLWLWYKEQYDIHQYSERPQWAWGNYANGLSIESHHRKTYHYSKELQRDYPNPFTHEAFKALSKVSISKG